MVQKAAPGIWALNPSIPSTLWQREVQDLEGGLGLVLGSDGEFADGLAEVAEGFFGRATDG